MATFVFGILMVLFVVVCLLLVLVVLIQSDKGGGISGALGGGLAGANALLGTQNTADILTRATTVLAAAYMVLCIVISLGVSRMAAGGEAKSMLKERAENYEAPADILQGGGLQLEEDLQEAGGAEEPVEGGTLQFGSEAPAEEPASESQPEE